jgi:hypothetical protein
MVNATREPLYGEVEIDDTWIGGPQPGLRGSRQLKGRKAAITLVAVERRKERSGRVRMAVVPVKKKSPVGRVQIIVVFGLLLGFTEAFGIGWQGDQTATISVNNPRPLAEVLEELGKRYGWVVTYEDPSYLYASDVEDVTLSVRRDGRAEPRVLVPRGGSFNFQYPVLAASGGTPDERAVLAKLIADYNLSGHPGLFGLIRSGTAFHVVPLQTRNASGHFVPRGSLLDRNISIANVERSALDMLRAITDAVSNPEVARVVVGTVPLNSMILTRVQGGAAGENARTVLLRTLEMVSPQLTWSLLCGPGPVPECALNVFSVARPVTPGQYQ